MRAMLPCPRCGTLADDRAPFCPGCGQQLRAAAPGQGQAPQYKPRADHGGWHAPSLCAGDAPSSTAGRLRRIWRRPLSQARPSRPALRAPGQQPPGTPAVNPKQTMLGMPSNVAAAAPPAGPVDPKADHAWHPNAGAGSVPGSRPASSGRSPPDHARHPDAGASGRDCRPVPTTTLCSPASTGRADAKRQADDARCCPCRELLPRMHNLRQRRLLVLRPICRARSRRCSVWRYPASAPTHDAPAQVQAPVVQQPSEHRTMLGIARPGIAPVDPGSPPPAAWRPMEQDVSPKREVVKRRRRCGDWARVPL